MAHTNSAQLKKFLVLCFNFNVYYIFGFYVFIFVFIVLFLSNSNLCFVRCLQNKKMKRGNANARLSLSLSLSLWFSKKKISPPFSLSAHGDHSLTSNFLSLGFCQISRSLILIFFRLGFFHIF